jgi:hypothetical protein
MVYPNHLEGYDPFGRALMQFSAKTSTPKPADNAPPSAASTLRQHLETDAPEAALDWDNYETPTLICELEGHSQPLEPLREKDLTALIDLFGDSNMRDIDADVQTRLQAFYPEPCWEDDLYAFLRGYL